MHKYRGFNRQFGGGSFMAAGAVNANTVNITNITQVTQIVRTGCSKVGRTRLSHRYGQPYGGRKQRPSQLVRYLAEGRSEGELCKESVRTLGIAAHGFVSCADDLTHHAGGVVRSAGRVAKGVVGLIAAFCGKDIF